MLKGEIDMIKIMQGKSRAWFATKFWRNDERIVVRKMKYFCSNHERNGSSYHEYQLGTVENHEYWLNDSLYLSAEISRTLGLDDILFLFIKNYDPYSASRYTVTKGIWEKIVSLANTKDDDLKAAIAEMTPWVENNFKNENQFYIITI